MICSPHAEQLLQDLTRLREFKQIPVMQHKKLLTRLGMELGQQLRRQTNGPMGVYMASYDAHYFGRGVCSKLNEGVGKTRQAYDINIFWYETRNMTVGEWVGEEVSWSNNCYRTNQGRNYSTSIVVSSTIESFSQNRALIARAFEESKCEKLIFATPVTTIDAEARLRNEMGSKMGDSIEFFTLTSNPKYVLDEGQATIGGYKEMTKVFPYMVREAMTKD